MRRYFFSFETSLWISVCFAGFYFVCLNYSLNLKYFFLFLSKPRLIFYHISLGIQSYSCVQSISSCLLHITQYLCFSDDVFEKITLGYFAFYVLILRQVILLSIYICILIHPIILLVLKEYNVAHVYKNNFPMPISGFST